MKYISVRILLIQSGTVMLDRDMAELSGLKTKRKNGTVRRNIKKFTQLEYFANYSLKDLVDIKQTNFI